MSARVLLDTHIWLWAVATPERLSPAQRHMLENPATELLTSAISVAEIEIKRAIGKLSMPHTCEDLRTTIKATALPLLATHAMALRSLPLHHRDPFDRLLIAQAMIEEVPLVSSDAAMHAYTSNDLRLLT